MALRHGDVRFDLSRAGATEFVEGLWTSGNFFDVLGVPAVLGRTFTMADDDRGGGPDGPVAVISYAFWQRSAEKPASSDTLTLDRRRSRSSGSPSFLRTEPGAFVRRRGAARHAGDRAGTGTGSMPVRPGCCRSWRG